MRLQKYHNFSSADGITLDFGVWMGIHNQFLLCTVVAYAGVA